MQVYLWLYCVGRNSSNFVIKFADDTAVIGQVTRNDEKAYLEEVVDLQVPGSAHHPVSHTNILATKARQCFYHFKLPSTIYSGAVEECIMHR